MISSTSNSQIKYINALIKKSKSRKEEKLFVVEGIKMFLETPKDKIKKVYVSEKFMKENNEKHLFEGIDYETVSDTVFETMSDTKTPQGVLALVKQCEYSFDEMIKGKQQMFIILSRLQDPGNLGTIVRSAEGAGVTGIIMDQGTADIYNPKVIRSTMGSIFRVPFCYTEDLPQAILKMKKNNIKLYAAHLRGTKNYDEENYKESCGFMIGNESNGLSDEIAEMADNYIKIPMLGKVESLNAAMAASILAFEGARQRRQK